MHPLLVSQMGGQSRRGACVAGSPLTLLSGLTQGEMQQKRRFTGDGFFCLAALLGACGMHKTSSDDALQQMEHCIVLPEDNVCMRGSDFTVRSQTSTEHTKRPTAELVGVTTSQFQACIISHRGHCVYVSNALLCWTLPWGASPCGSAPVLATLRWPRSSSQRAGL